MTTTTDAELLKLAEAATPGPWRTFRNRHTTTDGHEWGWVAPAHNSRLTINGMSIVWERPEGETNARFLAAASPDRVKALVMRVRELEAGLDSISDLSNETVITDICRKLAKEAN